MLSPTLCAHYCNYVDNLFRYFLEQFKNLYAIEEICNLRTLCHLADDVRRFGPLDCVSALHFENSWANLKGQKASTYSPANCTCCREEVHTEEIHFLHRQTQTWWKAFKRTNTARQCVKTTGLEDFKMLQYNARWETTV